MSKKSDKFVAESEGFQGQLGERAKMYQADADVAHAGSTPGTKTIGSCGTLGNGAGDPFTKTNGNWQKWGKG